MKLHLPSTVLEIFVVTFFFFLIQRNIKKVEEMLQHDSVFLVYNTVFHDEKSQTNFVCRIVKA